MGGAGVRDVICDAPSYSRRLAGRMLCTLFAGVPACARCPGAAGCHNIPKINNLVRRWHLESGLEALKVERAPVYAIARSLCVEFACAGSSWRVAI